MLLPDYILALAIIAKVCVTIDGDNRRSKSKGGGKLLKGVPD
jgi:hypothetical protein